MHMLYAENPAEDTIVPSKRTKEQKNMQKQTRLKK